MQVLFFPVNQRHLILKYLLPAFRILLRIGECQPVVAGRAIFLGVWQWLYRPKSGFIQPQNSYSSHVPKESKVNLTHKTIDQSTGPVQIRVISDSQGERFIKRSNVLLFLEPAMDQS